MSVVELVLLARTLDHAGPLARTVGDAANFRCDSSATIRAVGGAGRSVRDAAEASANQARMAEEIISSRWMDPVVEAAIEAVKQMEALGAHVVDVEIPCVAEWAEPSTTIALAEASGYHAGEGYFPARAGEYSEDVQRRLKLGLEVIGRRSSLPTISAPEKHGRVRSWTGLV